MFFSFSKIMIFFNYINLLIIIIPKISHMDIDFHYDIRNNLEYSSMHVYICETKMKQNERSAEALSGASGRINLYVLTYLYRSAQLR